MRMDETRTASVKRRDVLNVRTLPEVEQRRQQVGLLRDETSIRERDWLFVNTQVREAAE